MRKAAAEAQVELTVVDGTLIARCPEVPAAASRVLDALALILEQRTHDIPALLLLRLDDPIPGVRHAAFDLLTSNATSPIATAAAQRALTSADTDLKIAALRHLGMGAAPLAIALDTQASPQARLEAIEQLRLGGAPTFAAATALLSTAPSNTLVELLSWLATHEQASHLPQIVALLDISADTSVQRGALRALGALGGVEHAGVITPYLRRGTASVRESATAALDALRARHDLGDGGLSITSAAGGELSAPATASEGQVSEPTSRRRGLTERES